MGEASRRKRERRALRGIPEHAGVLDELAFAARVAQARQNGDGVSWEAVPGLTYTEARGADGNMYAWVGDTPPPGYVEPQSSGPPMVVTKVDRERKVITVG